MNNNTTKKTIAMVSLGCDKNRVDTEHILFNLVEAGYEIVERAEEADYLFINTCAFIESAKKESIDAILEFYEARQNPKQKIVVLGCLASRYREVLKEEMPEIDILVGMEHYHELLSILEKGERMPPKREGFLPFEAGRVITTPYHYAYLKIADGCDNWCSYCAIPAIRGRYRSYPQAALVGEAKDLLAQGVKELILVAQDVTRYGKDQGSYQITALLDELTTLGFDKIRLLYCYPELLTDELLERVANHPGIAKYLDIPLQHAHSAVLKRMNRRTTGEEQLALIKKIRAANPNIVIRSSFIVGFPGETEEEYLALKEFIAAGNIDYAGFFAYSKEEGTAAARMKNQVPAKIKNARAKELSRIQSAVIEEKHKRYLGKVLPVRYEGIDYQKQCFIGRTEYNAPVVDTLVYFTAGYPLNIGEEYPVRITKTGFHLVGEAEPNQ